MKMKSVKKLVILATVAVMGLTMGACGNKAEEAAVAEDTSVAEDAASEDTTAEDTSATEAETQEPAAEEAPAEEPVQDAADSAEAETGALTEDEYVAKAEELVAAMSTTMTEAQEKLAGLTESDVDAAKELIESLKAPFVEFAGLQAPEKFAEAQGKFKSGCDAMAEYLDLCVAMMDPEAAAEMDPEEVTVTITELTTTLQNDFVEAATMMDALTAE